jgi:hypothetical protein
MITSHIRGNIIYFDGKVWRYKSDNTIADYDKPCARCGQMPTSQGHDACLGNIKNVKNACCGHGVSEPYVEYK